MLTETARKIGWLQISETRGFFKADLDLLSWLNSCIQFVKMYKGSFFKCSPVTKINSISLQRTVSHSNTMFYKRKNFTNERVLPYLSVLFVGLSYI